MIISNFQNAKLDALYGYFNYLLNNLLEVATEEILKLAREKELALLELFSSLTEQQLFEYTKASLKDFLTSVSEGRIIEKQNETLAKWKADKIENIPQNKVQLSDVIIANNIRRSTFLKLLKYFSQDPDIIITIARELEELYMFIEYITIKTFVEIQETDLKNLTLDLKEHKEELQATIEELREQVEIRKETEYALEKERNFLGAIMENMNDGIVACDEHGILSFFNDATRKFHGIPERSLPPQEWAKHYNLYHADGITPMDTEEVPLYRVYNGEEVTNIQMMIISADGQKRDILASGRKIISEDGKIMGAVCVMQDITQKKREEELKKQLLIQEIAIQEAQRQEKVLFQLFHEVPAPVSMIKGKDLRYVLVNKQYQDIIFPGRKLLGLPLLEAVPEIEGAPIMDIINNVYATGKRYVGNEVPIDLDRGKGSLEKSYFNFVYEPTFSQDGQPDGIFSFAYEVTDLVVSRNNLQSLTDDLAAANEELTAANEDLSKSALKLEKANIDLDNFIYTASHDLKAPAVNLEGLFTLLKNEFGNKFDLFGKNLLEMMEKSIKQLYKTIFDLSQITIAQKDLMGDFSEISFKEIVDEVLSDIQSLINGSNAMIEKNIQAETIYFNRSSIRSIFYNLLTNAIKYRSEQRPLRICISISTEENNMVISIQDNGLGIAANQQHKLFAMFKRFHSHVEGTGIGLYIIKRMVENRGGSIAVESKEGMGSTFKVNIPLTSNN